MIHLVDFKTVRKYCSAGSAELLKEACSIYEVGDLLLATDYSSRAGVVGWFVGSSASLGRVYQGTAPTVSASFSTINIIYKKTENREVLCTK